MSDSVSHLRTMNLHVIFADEHYSKTMLAIIMVVDIPSIYNGIIDRSMLNSLRLVVSIFNIVMKFLMGIGIGELRSNPRESC